MCIKNDPDFFFILFFNFSVSLSLSLSLFVLLLFSFLTARFVPSLFHFNADLLFSFYFKLISNPICSLSYCKSFLCVVCLSRRKFKIHNTHILFVHCFFLFIILFFCLILFTSIYLLSLTQLHLPCA